MDLGRLCQMYEFDRFDRRHGFFAGGIGIEGCTTRGVKGITDASDHDATVGDDGQGIGSGPCGRRPHVLAKKEGSQQ